MIKAAWELHPGVRPGRGRGPKGCATWSNASRPGAGAGERAPSTPTTRSRSCSRRRPRASTAGRARSPATSRRRTSPRLGDAGGRARRARPAEHGVSLVERPLPPASSPRPDFDGPALIRRADVTRHVWGDPRRARSSTGSTRRPSRCTCSCSGSRRAAVPPLGGVPHDLRRRRAAARAAGVMVIADPRPARSSGPASGRACSSAATRGTTRSRSAPSRCGCSSCSRRRRPPARRAPTPARSRTWSRRASGRRCSATGRRPGRAIRACACCATPTCCGAATWACCAGCWSAPST